MNVCVASVSTKKPDTTAEPEPWPAVAEPVFAACAESLSGVVVRSGVSKPSLVVAYSGGLDSHVLLRAAHRWCHEHGAATVRAVYIDHGLQQCSGDWAKHCQHQCNTLGIAYESLAVSVSATVGESPEQAARTARYQALAGLLSKGEILLTAHHADDQAETLLLQLLRGAGVAGLASMPLCKDFSQGVLARPLLSTTREQLQDAAVALALDWVEDTTNRDTRFDRNYLRHEILPRLKARWPATAASVSRSAGHCAEASLLLHDLGATDAAIESPVLSVQSLTDLSGARRRNVLRQWIEQHGFVPPSTVKMRHLECDLVMASAGSSGQLQFGSAQIVRHRDRLYIGHHSLFNEAPAFLYQWTDRSQPLLIEETGQQLTAGDIPLPWSADSRPLVVMSRQGGEKIKLNARMHTQSVKSLLQQMGQPPWERSRLPFVWCNDELIGIVGIGFTDPPG